MLNSSVVGVNKKRMSCNSYNSSYYFTPINEISQRFMCSIVELPVIVKPKSMLPKPLGSPSKLYHTRGDGNCLFRCLSYVLTGRQVYHTTLRTKILSHMRDIENELRPHMNCSLDEYLTRSSMENDTVWGTDVEIFAASSLLKTDIYVHTKVGNNFKWLLFSKRMLNGSLPKNQCAIYIKHVNGVHYDVVLDVMSDSVTGSGIKRKHKEATVEKPKSYKKTV